MLLRPIFAPKMKIAPLWDWRAEVVKDLLLLGLEKWNFFSGPQLKLVGKTDWIWVKTFFSFGDNPIWTGKTVSILVKTFFFWRSSDFERKTASIWFKTYENLVKPPQSKTASIWFKTDENLDQVHLLLLPASKKPPPPLFANSWLRAWWLLTVSIAKFYIVSQISNTESVYAINIIVRCCNLLCNVVTKCSKYDDQFRPSGDPDYLVAKWATCNNFVRFSDAMFFRLQPAFMCREIEFN